MCVMKIFRVSFSFILDLFDVLIIHGIFDDTLAHVSNINEEK